MEGSNKISVGVVVIIAVIVLAAGAVAGYVVGANAGEVKGVAIGRDQILSEQATAEATKLQELQKAANPFTETSDAANPFKDAYKNPFE